LVESIEISIAKTNWILLILTKLLIDDL